MGINRWMRRRWSRALPAVALLAGVTVPAAGANAAPALTAASSPYELTALPAGAKLTDDAGVTPRYIFGGHVEHGIKGVDGVPNFSGHFNVKGLNGTGQLQNQWETNFVGTPPQQGGTTTISAPIIPVTIQLLGPDGSVAQSMSAAPYETVVANSPVFAPAKWSSSATPTQLPDAIQRAEFYKQATPDWHTMLAPQLAASLTMQVPYGNWYYIPNRDGSCCKVIFVDLNPFLYQADSLMTQLSNEAMSDGTMTSKDITTFLFPNMLLYLGSPQLCCALGFHSYYPIDLPDGIEQRDLVNISSWFPPGSLSPDFQDVSTLSHEMAEIFNDPFVASDNIHGITPWWLSGGLCSDYLEVGDVVEYLADQIYPMTLNGYSYHIQNVALRQWFDTGQPSDALGGAYSYPDTSVLTSPATFQNVNCSP